MSDHAPASDRRNRDVVMLHAVDVAAGIRVVVGITFLLVITALVLLAAVQGHENRCERLRDEPDRWQQICAEVQR